MKRRSVHLGLWPGDVGLGNDYQTLVATEAKLGRAFTAYRERGGRGSLNTPLYKPGMALAVNGGRMASLELNCRLDTQDNYIPFTRVLRGEFDAELRQRAAEAVALSGGPHLCELQSEANLSKHNSGTPEDMGSATKSLRCRSGTSLGKSSMPLSPRRMEW